MGAKVVWFLYACDVPFNVIHSPYQHDMIPAINKSPKGYKVPRYEKVKTVLIDKERAKYPKSSDMVYR